MAFYNPNISDVSSQVSRWYSYGKILLVGEDQEEGISELVLVQHSLELLASLNNTIAIVAVNDEDDALGVLEVMPPERSDLVLACGSKDAISRRHIFVNACCAAYLRHPTR